MYSLHDDIVFLPPGDLIPSPGNKAVHADFEPAGRDAWLLDDIRQHGVLTPLQIFPDKSVNDGHRRRAMAILAKQSTVPCVMLKTTNRAAAFSSAQLARQMSVFAKCSLYRDKIVDLRARGVAFRGIKGGRPKADETENAAENALQQDWIQCEEVLGISRKYLLMGLKLLEQIDALRASGQPADIDRAARAESTFRNRSIRAAMRFLGEKKPAADDEISEVETDCVDWSDADDPAPEPRPKPRAAICKFAPKDEEEQAPWIVEALKSCARIETLAKKNGRYTPAIESALDSIEAELNGGAARAA